MSASTHSTTFWSYAWRQSCWQLMFCLLLVLLLVVLLLLHRAPPDWWTQSFAQFFDPAIAIGTLVVAGMVWYNEQRKSWRSSWEKKLHVFFLEEKPGGGWKEHLTVLDAPLSSEADIRAWGQSIGQTVVPDEAQRVPFFGHEILPTYAHTKTRTLHHGIFIFLRSPMLMEHPGRTLRYRGPKPETFDPGQLPEQHPVRHYLQSIPNA